METILRSKKCLINEKFVSADVVIKGRIYSKN